MCAFVVLGLVFPYQAKRLAWGRSPKWPILCRVVGMLISSFAQIWISHLKIRYKSRYRFCTFAH